MKGRKPRSIESKTGKDTPEKKKVQSKALVKVEINVDECCRLYELGLTDEEIGYALSLERITILRAKARFPELRAAYEKGSKVANERVEQSLFKRACGYEYIEETKEPVLVMNDKGKLLTDPELKVTKVVKKHVPPDVAAISMWLRNKKAEDWKDLKPVIIQNNQNNLVITENKIKAEEVNESHIAATRSNFESLRKFRIIDAETIETN